MSIPSREGMDSCLRCLPDCFIDVYTQTLRLAVAELRISLVEMAGLAQLQQTVERSLQKPSGVLPTVQPRSKRSRFITLVHAATKSLTKRSCASELP